MINDFLNLRKEYNDNVIIIKCGLFYNTYSEDALILNYLTGYKIYSNNNFLCCSFTEKTLNLVLNRLRIKDIGYVLINKKVKEISVGDGLAYEKLMTIAKDNYEKNIFIADIVSELKDLNIDKLKEILNMLDRKE